MKKGVVVMKKGVVVIVIKLLKYLFELLDNSRELYVVDKKTEGEKSSDSVKS